MKVWLVFKDGIMENNKKKRIFERLLLRNEIFSELYI